MIVASPSSEICDASTVSSMLTTSSTKRPSAVLTKPGRARSSWWEPFYKFDEKVHPEKKGWAKCVHCGVLVHNLNLKLADSKEQ
jgi:hypothetical protein